MDDLRENVLGTKNNHAKFTSLTIEETYELGDAILDNDLVRVKELRLDVTPCFMQR
jgi:NTP pyrophosphatase (non-canonical NTP hydrolase)